MRGKRHMRSLALGLVLLGSLLVVYGAGDSPAQVRTLLLKDAEGAARRDHAVGAWSAAAVRTTYGKAAAVQRVRDLYVPTNTPVYLIAMRGDFPGVCHGPGGACPPGRIAEFDVPTSSPEAIIPGQITSSPVFPRLKQLGVPVRLFGPEVGELEARGLRELRQAAERRRRTREANERAEAPTAVLIVRVVGKGDGKVPLGGHERDTPEETGLIHIQRLGPKGEVLGSILTGDHRWPVTPGHYKIAAAKEVPRGQIQVFEGKAESKEATVRAGQTLGVTVYARSESSRL